MSKKKDNKWLTFVAIPAQLAITTVVFNYIGCWIDSTYFNGEPIYEKWITLLGIFISIYSIIKQVIYISNKK